MYRFNVYQDFDNNEFKFLTVYSCFAETRELAKVKALEWAVNAYPNKKVSVMSVN